MTPYWLVMGARVYPRQAATVQPTGVRDADGLGWLMLTGRGTRDWGQAYLDEADALADALAYARRWCAAAERELARSQSDLLPLWVAAAERVLALARADLAALAEAA